MSASPAGSTDKIEGEMRDDGLVFAFDGVAKSDGTKALALQISVGGISRRLISGSLMRKVAACHL